MFEILIESIMPCAQGSVSRGEKKKGKEKKKKRKKRKERKKGREKKKKKKKISAQIKRTPGGHLPGKCVRGRGRFL